ncbi:MADS-box transcription factor [Parasponia andersonii]|uniref:MADS-box transcription factor n=1 Tax=Parasponia andersonii TaxID=3476 RepID=A0A2P5ATV3_PARAD|nr:MADS-box transcription factor [Parasponia andersonii]
MAANNNNNNNKNKKTKGRQKIEMKMIQDEDDRLITFSKRRSGIYKKASELVTLCGAEVGVVIFSPSGKPFSYGHPSIDAVSHRLLSNQPNLRPLPHTAAVVDATTHPIVEAHRRIRINKLNQQYDDMFDHLEAEKERMKEMEKVTLGETEKVAVAPKGWWDAPIEGLSLDELKQKQRSLEELHANISKRITMSLSSFNNNNKNNNALAPRASSSFYAGNIHGSSSSQRAEPFVYRPSTTGLHYPHSEHGYGYGHVYSGDLGPNQQ